MSKREQILDLLWKAAYDRLWAVGSQDKVFRSQCINDARESLAMARILRS